MIHHINKPKLPRGLSYVLKTSIIESLLESSGIDSDAVIDFCAPSSEGYVFEVFYSAPKSPSWESYAQQQLVRDISLGTFPFLFIRAGSVAGAERKTALMGLTNDAFPAFVSWFSRVAALPTNSPLLFKPLFFGATWKAGKISIHQDLLR